MRDYRFLSGGHLKVYDYFNHIRKSRVYRPQIYFSPESRLENGPWAALPHEEIIERPGPAAAYFLGGFDWRIADAYALDLTTAPVYNLIQHFRHADPSDARFAYLSRPAIRICVTETLADRIRQNGANGPVIGIEAAPPPIEVDRSRNDKVVDVFVSAAKDHELGIAVAGALRGSGWNIDLLLESVPRKDFLRRMAVARIAVLIPSAVEGYYLPALEAMSLGTPCVTIDAVGNRSFCRDDRTCLIAGRDARSLVRDSQRLLNDLHLREAIRHAGLVESAEHSLTMERTRVLAVIDDPVLRTMRP